MDELNKEKRELDLKTLHDVLTEAKIVHWMQRT